MKKLISFVLAFAVLLNFIPAGFAAGPAKTPESYDTEGNFSMSFDISGADLGEEMEDILNVLNNIDVKFKGTLIQSGVLSVKAYFDFEMTAGGFTVPFKTWIDLDMTNMENMVYVITVELSNEIRQFIVDSGAPAMFDKQYWVIDYTRLFNSMSDIEELDWSLVTSSYNMGIELGTEIVTTIQSWFEQQEEHPFSNLVDDNIIETLGENHYRIALKDAQVKEICIRFVDGLVKMLSSRELINDLIQIGSKWVSEIPGFEDVELPDEEELIEAVDMLISQFMAPIQSELQKIYGIIRGVEVFPGDGIVYEYKTDSDGYNTYENLDINFKLDLPKWYESLMKEYPYFGGADSSPSLVFSAQIGAEASYSNINATAPIAFPVTTSENSVDFVDMIDSGFTGASLGGAVGSAGLSEELDFNIGINELNLSSDSDGTGDSSIPGDSDGTGNSSVLNNSVVSDESNYSNDSNDPYESFEPVKVFVDSGYINFLETKPILVNNRTMIPPSMLRGMGIDVEGGTADGDKVVVGPFDGNVVELTIGSNSALVNGASKGFDVGPYIDSEGQTMIPLRFVFENLGFTVDYDSNPVTNCDIEVYVFSAP